MSFFEDRRPAGGDGSFCLNLAGLSIRIGGLDAAFRDQLDKRYHPYTGEPEDDAVLEVELGHEDREYFFDPPERPELNRILIACDGDRVRYLGYRVAGWFDLGSQRGQVLLARGDYEPAHLALENYIRAAVAWNAAIRGGMLVHAASAVWKDRGYLFFGQSGAGKSTLSECNRRARVVSDDLSLLMPGRNGGLDLIGSPFRGTYEGGGPVQGRFPLAAGFRLIQDTSASVRDVLRIQVLGQLIGNLPFVAERFGDRPDLFDKVEQALTDVPLAHLHFRKDDSYWDAIESAGL